MAMRVQSLIFARAKGWTAAKAKAWAKRHGFRYGSVEIPRNGKTIRLRQVEPHFRIMRTIPLSERKGIKAVVARNGKRTRKRKATKRRRNPALHWIEHLAPNMLSVRHGDWTVLYSYDTPVAAFHHSYGYLVTTKKHSQTTTRHINKWAKPTPDRPVQKVSQQQIEHIAEHAMLPNPQLAVFSSNPKRGDVLSKRVLALRYIHADDGERYEHKFNPGVEMRALPDGTVLLSHRSKRLWGDF